MTDYQYYFSNFTLACDQSYKTSEKQYYAFMALKHLPKGEKIPPELFPYLNEMARMALGEREVVNFRKHITRDFWNKFAHEVQILHLKHKKPLDKALEAVSKMEQFKYKGEPYSLVTCKRKYEDHKMSKNWDIIFHEWESHSS